MALTTEFNDNEENAIIQILLNELAARNKKVVQRDALADVQDSDVLPVVRGLTSNRVNFGIIKAALNAAVTNASFSSITGSPTDNTALVNYIAQEIANNPSVDVLATLLTGLVTDNNTPAQASDSLIIGVGKLQAQISDMVNTFLAVAGGTMTGNLLLNGDPSVDLQAATKQYVDNNTASLPLTTKGDLITRSASGNERKAIGTDGQLLRANSNDLQGNEYFNLTFNPGNLSAGGNVSLVSNGAEILARRISISSVITSMSVDSVVFLRHQRLEFFSTVESSVEFGAGHTFDGSNDQLTNFPIAANEVITCLGYYNGSQWKWTRSPIKSEFRAFAAEITFNRNVTYDPMFIQGVGTLAITRAAVGNFSDKTHLLRITTNGNPITLGPEFVQLVGSVDFMSANPGVYDVFFYNQQTPGGIDQVLVSIPRAVSAEDTTAPLLVSAEIGNVDDTSLILTYNEALDTGSVPAVGDFSITSASANAATNVSVNGNTVDITLTNAVVGGAVVQIDYTAGTNPIRDQATIPNNAANLVAQSVTNNVAADTTDPIWATVNFEIGNVSSSKVVMPANEALNPLSSDVSHFTVRVASVIRSVSSLAFTNSNQNVELTLASPVTPGQAVTVTYNGNGQLNSIRDVAGNEINNLLTETSVTNNVTGGNQAPVASNLVVSRLVNRDILIADAFTGSTINTGKWTIDSNTPANVAITQSNALILTDLANGAAQAQTANRIVGDKTLLTGNYAVVQCNLTFSASAESEQGFALFEGPNNYAAIINKKSVVGDVYSLTIVSVGTEVYSLDTAITHGKDVRISITAANLIKFEYWNGSAWTQMGTDQTFGLGTVKGCFFSESTTDVSVYTMTADNFYMTTADYTTQFPTIDFKLSLAYDYSDNESDAEGTSTFEWYKDDDGAGTNKAIIVGATSQEYVVPEADAGKWFYGRVTPVALTGTSPGIQVESSAFNVPDTSVLLSTGNPLYLYATDLVTGVLPINQVPNGDSDYDSTTTSTPTIVTGMNGLDVWSYVAAANNIRTLAQPLISSQPFYRWMLIEFKTSIPGSGVQYIMDSRAAANDCKVGVFNGNWIMFGGAVLDSGISPLINTPYLVEAFFNGASSYLRINNTEVVAGDIGGTDDLVGITIGNDSGNSTSTTQEIHEDYANNGTLSAGDLTAIRNNLASKAGITLA